SGKLQCLECRPPLNAARARQPNRGRPLRQNWFAPDQGVEPAMPLFHLGGRGVVCTHHGPATAKALSGSSAQDPSNKDPSPYPGRLPSQGRAATRNEALPLKPGGCCCPRRCWKRIRASSYCSTVVVG